MKHAQCQCLDCKVERSGLSAKEIIYMAQLLRVKERATVERAKVAAPKKGLRLVK